MNVISLTLYFHVISAIFKINIGLDNSFDPNLLVNCITLILFPILFIAGYYILIKKKRGGGAGWLLKLEFDYERNGILRFIINHKYFLFERGRHNHIGAPTDLKLKRTEEIRIEKWLIAFVLRHLRCTTRFDSF